ncbi:dihydrodipicolinate synthase family protein [uncultured Muribaculum sp.]|uniref:dihydrodipicolinate synthase family protein n=1 Tax=uncultured Muribaculum sp. TaxID=1918613 RepID=UPI0025D26B20|nr:dihydrodipicolinate synthase family protein [uncultured Muribaculum sp.]
MAKFPRLSGMIAATFTPMKENGDINYDEIKRYADYIASTPVEGVFVNGTTGEFSSLTIDERRRILKFWVDAAEGRFKVICHVGSNCQRDSMELAAHAAASGAYGIGCIAPSFFKPATVKAIVDFFAPIAASAPEFPFYYYNMPSMTGVNLPVDKILAEGRKVMPNLAGTKFTHNNLMEMGVCINLQDGEFEVLHGYDEILVSGLAMGAKAGVGSTYNYIPSIYDGIFKAMAASDLEKARELQLKSIKTVEVIIKYGGGVRGGKAIMNLIGINCGECRPPFLPLTKEEYAALEADLDALGFVK